MNLNWIVTSSLLKEALLPHKKSFNTLMLIKVDAGKAGKTALYTTAREAQTAGESEEVVKHLEHIFMQEKSPSFVKVGFVSELSADALNELSALESWYFTLFIEGEMTKDNLTDIAMWLEANKKFGVVEDKDPDNIADGGGGMTKAYFDTQTDHMMVLYYKDKDEDGADTDKYSMIAPAIISGMASVDFADRDSFYTVPHLVPNIRGTNSFGLTPKERTNLTGYIIDQCVDPSLGYRGNFYGEYEGFSFIYEGLTSTGALISEAVFADWLNYTIQYDAASYFKQNKVTGYDDASLAGIALMYRRSLLKGVRAGGLLTEQLKVADIANIKEILADSPEFRSCNTLPVLTAQVKCTGAIHHLRYETQCVPYGKDLG